MCGAYSSILDFKQMPVVSPVEHSGCPPPHAAQEERHIHRLGNFIPEFVGRGQDASRRLSVVPQMKHYLQSVYPVFAPHFSNRNYPSSFDHFFTSIILCYPKYAPGTRIGIGVSFESMNYFFTSSGAGDFPPCLKRDKLPCRGADGRSN
jgi:hypothetical protein